MIKVLFICHGNICRSPLAEFVLKDMTKERGIADKFEIASAATSTEEIGNDMHRGSKAVLRKHGIAFGPRQARRVTKSDYAYYDYLIGMDTANIRNMNRMLDGDPEDKIYKLLAFDGEGRDVADPWYTGDFDATYRDVVRGCEALLRELGY